MIRETNTVPHRYGLHKDEWNEDGYSSVKVIQSGKRGSRLLEVGLPNHIWRPRAELWVQALEILTRLQDETVE
jgi:hypothetical protein